jgi:hypothetical protein
MCHGVTRFWHHALEQLRTDDRGLWLDLCGLALAGASFNVEFYTAVFYHYSWVSLHVFSKIAKR